MIHSEIRCDGCGFAGSATGQAHARCEDGYNKAEQDFRLNAFKDAQWLIAECDLLSKRCEDLKRSR